MASFAGVKGGDYDVNELGVARLVYNFTLPEASVGGGRGWCPPVEKKKGRRRGGRGDIKKVLVWVSS